MATWVTHLMIADRIMEEIPNLDRCDFVLEIFTPDCNIEMKIGQSLHRLVRLLIDERKKKTASDQHLFCKEYIIKRNDEIKSKNSFHFC